MNPLCLMLVFLLNHERPLVKILDGSLLGTTVKTWTDNNTFAFLGIPYAAPPVGDLRFEPPQKVVPWIKTRDASNFGNICKQPKSRGSEDCLYLNVYVPASHKSCSGKNKEFNGLPVVVFFHGGSWKSGSGSEYGPKYLLDNDVILVTANYRLGPLGFMSAGDEVLPGNNGLKDQSAVLKWVRNNIALFGGDKSRVTIAGVASGGTSVQFHYTSPLSKDLFHGGIVYSGSVLQPNAFQKNPIGKFRDYARRFHCSSIDTRSILTCLKKADADELTNYQDSYLGFDNNPITIFGPVKEPVHKKAFITRYPIDSIHAGEITNAPLIMQSAKNEGLILTSNFFNVKDLQQINNNWNGIAPHLLLYNDVASASERKMIGDFIRKHYFGNKDINKDTFDQLTKLVSDRLFVSDNELSARLFAKACHSPVYLSKFSYIGRDSFAYVGNQFNLRGVHGVSHKDDILYVLDTPDFPSQKTPADKQMVVQMTAIWANFIATGSPGVNEWTPLDKKLSLEGPLRFLEFESPSSAKPVTAPGLSGELDFWKNLPVNEPWGARLSRVIPNQHHSLL